MKNEQALILTVALALWTLLICGYMRHNQMTFVMNNEEYIQVGVMAYQADGIYIPIYKKRGSMK